MSSQPSPGSGVPVCYRHPSVEAHIRCQRCDRPICPDCMRDAAVGFHCPECVAQGRRSTRQDRTTYGGIRSRDASLTTTVLIGLNVAVWIAILATGGAGSRLLDFLLQRTRGLCAAGDGGFAVTREQCAAVPGAQWVPGVSDGAAWELVTSMFAHIEVWHIGFNMLALWILGPQLELVLGRARFLSLYLLSGLAGSTMVYWAAPEYQGTLGASGAIFGLLGALLVVVVKMGGQYQQILVLLGINAVITFTIPNISWQGHLGGFLGGLLIAAILVYAPRQRRTFWQWLGLGLFALFLVAALVVRTLVLL